MKSSFRLEPEDYRDTFRATDAKNRRIREMALLAMAILLSAALLRAPGVTGGHVFVATVLLWLVLLGLFLASRQLSEPAFERSYRGADSTEPTRELVMEIPEEGIASKQPPLKDEWKRFSRYLDPLTHSSFTRGNLSTLFFRSELLTLGELKRFGALSLPYSSSALISNDI